MDIVTFLIIFLAGLAFLIIGKLNADRMRQTQGQAGERQVAKKLKFWLGSKKNYLFNDVTLPTASGTTQIDHLLICSRGVFCIETKNLNGILRGDEDEQYWLHINRRGDKNQIYNPLKQNAGHIRHLTRILQLDSTTISGYVVNVGSAKLQGNIKPFWGKPLIRQGTGFVFSIWLLPKNQLSQELVDALGQQVQATALKNDRVTQKAHIAHAKKYSKKKGWFS